MEVARPDAWVYRHFRTWAALEAAGSHEVSWGTQGSYCACLRRMQRWLPVGPAVAAAPGLFALTKPRLVAVVEHPAQESATKS
jgi:hypothetical protein